MEIKHEPMEIKEEPSDNIEFNQVKIEETNGNDSMEIKHEPMEIKEEPSENIEINQVKIKETNGNDSMEMNPVTDQCVDTLKEDKDIDKAIELADSAKEINEEIEFSDLENSSDEDVDVQDISEEINEKEEKEEETEQGKEEENEQGKEEENEQGKEEETEQGKEKENEQGKENEKENESTSSSSSEDEDIPRKRLTSAEREEMLIRFDENDEELDAKTLENAIPRTKNEIFDVPVEKAVVVITEDMEIQDIGTVFNIVDNVVVVKANTSGDYQVLDTESILVFSDRTVLGLVFETFGPVKQPMYSIRFNTAEEIDKEVVQIGKVVCHVPQFSHYVFTTALRHIKGSDASNRYDEEAGEEEMEFSDDEQEAMYKRQLKQAKKNTKGGTTGTTGSSGKKLEDGDGYHVLKRGTSERPVQQKSQFPESYNRQQRPHRPQSQQQSQQQNFNNTYINPYPPMGIPYSQPTSLNTNYNDQGGAWRHGEGMGQGGTWNQGGGMGQGGTWNQGGGGNIPNGSMNAQPYYNNMTYGYGYRPGQGQVQGQGPSYAQWVNAWSQRTSTYSTASTSHPEAIDLIQQQLQHLQELQQQQQQQTNGFFPPSYGPM